MRIIRINGLCGLITSVNYYNRKLDVKTPFMHYCGLSFDDVEITPLILKKMK